MVPVVNWFQIVFLREDSQAIHLNRTYTQSCELISNCIFTWGLTSFSNFCNTFYPLWIDFKLYFYVRTHKYGNEILSNFIVVNWFQIVFLREDSQDKMITELCMECCELISNCIFTWGLTRNQTLNVGISLLWIDFKLYFYVRTHKMKFIITKQNLVVNWFQIVFLREDSQVM